MVGRVERENEGRKGTKQIETAGLGSSGPKGFGVLC